MEALEIPGAGKETLAIAQNIPIFYLYANCRRPRADPIRPTHFRGPDVPAAVAQRVARSLVLSNLKGHDSHGIFRVIQYVDWLSRGWINPRAELEVLRDDGAILMTHGHHGFGQCIGRQATQMAIGKTRHLGACILTLRRSGHLGRIGEFAELAAEAGLVHFSLANVHGGGVLVAPHAGRERRLSANPVTAAAPLEGGEAIVMDMATSTIAEGKLNVARARQEEVAAVPTSLGWPITGSLFLSIRDGFPERSLLMENALAFGIGSNPVVPEMDSQRS